MRQTTLETTIVKPDFIVSYHSKAEVDFLGTASQRYPEPFHIHLGVLYYLWANVHGCLTRAVASCAERLQRRGKHDWSGEVLL